MSCRSRICCGTVGEQELLGRYAGSHPPRHLYSGCRAVTGHRVQFVRCACGRPAAVCREQVASEEIACRVSEEKGIRDITALLLSIPPGGRAARHRTPLDAPSNAVTQGGRSSARSRNSSRSRPFRHAPPGGVHGYRQALRGDRQRAGCLPSNNVRSSARTQRLKAAEHRAKAVGLSQREVACPPMSAGRVTVGRTFIPLPGPASVAVLSVERRPGDFCLVSEACLFVHSPPLKSGGFQEEMGKRVSGCRRGHDRSPLSAPASPGPVDPQASRTGEEGREQQRHPGVAGLTGLAAAIHYIPHPGLVAEWQTQRTQNPPLLRVCGFKSHPGHKKT